MAATFQPDLSDDISKVRQAIGDTSVEGTKAKIQDETITATLVGNSVLRAAARLAYDLAAKYAGVADITIDHQTTRASQMYDHYIALGDSLTKRAKIEEGGTGPADASAYPGGYGITPTGIGDCRGPLAGPCLSDWPSWH